jgi:hypothetical protein
MYAVIDARSPDLSARFRIMVPRGNGLAIAHGANVSIDAVAANFDPIKR